MPSLSHLSPEAYRTILENLPAAVYLVDRDRRIVLWNDGCERITGYRRHEVLGRSCADDLLMHCDGHNDTMCGTACPLLETMHDGHPRDADLFLLHKDGQRVPVRVRAVPVRNEAGAIVGACECFDERVPVLPERHSVQLVEPPPSIDEVTGLPDPRTVLRRLRASLQEFRTSSIPFGVLCLTIDDLEHLRIKDGNNAVNSVLYATAQTLSKSVGPGNLVGRWSEGRFVVALRSCGAAALMESAVSLQRLVSLEAIPWWGDRLTVTLSAGGTVARAEDTAEELLRRAGEALDTSSKSGVNQTVLV